MHTTDKCQEIHLKVCSFPVEGQAIRGTIFAADPCLPIVAVA